MSWRHKSFEVLPALSVRGKSLRYSMRTVTVAWMFGIAWMACVCGSQMTLFCRMLGFNDRDFGILAALPWAATLAQAVAVTFIERTGMRKYPVVVYAGIHRILWLAIAAVPFFFGSGRGAITVFFIVFAISSVLAHLAQPLWWSWMSDLIPRRVRGRYFATRSLMTAPIQIVTVIAAGILLDRAVITDAPMTIDAQPVLLWTICGIFVCGGLMGMIDPLLHLRVREISSPVQADNSTGRRGRGFFKGLVWTVVEPVRLIAGSFRDSQFRMYAIYGMVITFSMTVGGQFFWLNALEKVGYSKLGANVVFMVCGSAGALMMVRFWGRLTDRWGRRPILILTTVGATVCPVVWLFISPGNLVLAYMLGGAAAIVAGTMWSGINLAQTGIILGFSETAGKSRYVAAAAIITAAGGFAGGIIGGQVAQSLHGFEISAGQFTWNNYHVIFLMAIAARIGAVFLAIGMPDPGAKPLRDIMKRARFNAYNNVMPRLFWRLRTLGQRRRNQNKNGT